MPPGRGGGRVVPTAPGGPRECSAGPRSRVATQRFLARCVQAVHRRSAAGLPMPARSRRSYQAPRRAVRGLRARRSSRLLLGVAHAVAAGLWLRSMMSEAVSWTSIFFRSACGRWGVRAGSPPTLQGAPLLVDAASLANAAARSRRNQMVPDIASFGHYLLLHVRQRRSLAGIPRRNEPVVLHRGDEDEGDHPDDQ